MYRLPVIPNSLSQVIADYKLASTVYTSIDLCMANAT